MPSDDWSPTLDSFTHEGGVALIDPVAGARLWREARRRRDAKARANAEVRLADAVVRAVMGDAATLVTTDGVGLAVVTLSVRRSLNKERLMESLGVADLSGFEDAHPVRSLDIAASIPEDHLP